MSNKKNEVQSSTTEQTIEITTQEVISAPSHLSIFEKMKEKPTSELVEETGDYFQMKENQEYNFICHGITTATIDDKVINVVMLEDEDGKKFIHGAIVLVNAMMKKSIFPIPIRIVTGGKKKSSKGAYLDLRVFTFGI